MVGASILAHHKPQATGFTVQLLGDCYLCWQEIEQLEAKLQRRRPESQETQMYDAFYVEDLEAKLEAHR